MRTIFLILVLCLAAPVYAADEKIDPPTYICAELVATSVDGQPPIYEGLQLDGYLSAKDKNLIADAETLAPMLIEVSNSCAAEPTDKALDHWREARKNHPVDQSGYWRADKITCADYQENPDDGSGFVIWLDAYNRGKTGKKGSILETQETLDHFLEVCKANPKKLILDVINDNVK